jgi:hypothetical protein
MAMDLFACLVCFLPGGISSFSSPNFLLFRGQIIQLTTALFLRARLVWLPHRLLHGFRHRSRARRSTCEASPNATGWLVVPDSTSAFEGHVESKSCSAVCQVSLQRSRVLHLMKRQSTQRRARWRLRSKRKVTGSLCFTCLDTVDNTNVLCTAMTACVGKMQSHSFLIYVVFSFSLRSTPLLASVGKPEKHFWR